MLCLSQRHNSLDAFFSTFFFFMIWYGSVVAQAKQINCENWSIVWITTQPPKYGERFLFAFPFFLSDSYLSTCLWMNAVQCACLPSKLNQPQICGKTPLFIVFWYFLIAAKKTNNFRKIWSFLFAICHLNVYFGLSIWIKVYLLIMLKL